MRFKLSLNKKQESENVRPEGVVRIETISKQKEVEEKQTEFLQKLSNEETTLMEEKKNLTSLREKLMLKELSSEETNLIEERQNLTSLKEKLQLKIKKKIEKKKNNIQKLRDEIKELKFSCEDLTKTLKTDIN
jgi:exonuclease VII large subunit